MSLCPCGSGEQYELCCGRFHSARSGGARSGGEAAAPTAAQLMRSRYSAFAVRDAAYLMRTWHPATRPRSLELDDDTEWTRLTILNTTGGGLLDAEGTVEFVAQYLSGGRRGRQHENSRFTRVDGAWVYVDGAV
ncbi:YchJ family protein [Tomitella biformata]|uniref:YchJ family protein n=1 Tax=Tomitella biformata TaxID=630403 RepID=UPI0004650292|nr:YchJ family protein [Tomitella biformata]